MSAVLVLAGLAALIGTGLALAAAALPARTDSLAERIDVLLPQQQCARCGYPGCRPYAEAIATGEADINQCAPGGDDTIEQLATLLQREPLPLNEAFGQAGPQRVALIDEDLCIGCARCLEACPVDAILGAHRYMHTVIAERCTGCELCLPPCPVDCISLPVVSSGPTTDR
jgi:electron transport complex protein RnfB